MNQTSTQTNQSKTLKQKPQKTTSRNSHASTSWEAFPRRSQKKTPRGPPSHLLGLDVLCQAKELLLRLEIGEAMAKTSVGCRLQPLDNGKD